MSEISRLEVLDMVNELVRELKRVKNGGRERKEKQWGRNGMGVLS